MIRILLYGTLLLVLGCTVSPEQVPLQPLPETGQVLPYASLLTRIRNQARAANEAFYLDRWNELEDMAKGIEQTARFLSKAEDVPQKKEIVKELTGDLISNARKLRDAAVAHNEKNATAAMQQIQIKVRRLHQTE